MVLLVGSPMTIMIYHKAHKCEQSRCSVQWVAWGDVLWVRCHKVGPDSDRCTLMDKGISSSSPML